MEAETTGKEHRESFEEYFKNQKCEWSEGDLEKFRIAAEILSQNKKDCEQFKGRIGI